MTHHFSMIAAIVSEPPTNEAADLIVKNLQYSYSGDINNFSCKTQGIVVGGNIKETRNCGYERMEELRWAVFHVLSSIDESKGEPSRTTGASVHNIQSKHSCGVSTNTYRSYLENYRHKEVRSNGPTVIEYQVVFQNFIVSLP